VAPPGEQTIGAWTPSILTKYIQDLFQTQPPGFIPLLKAEQVQVEKNLFVRDYLTIMKDPSFRKVGGTGHPAFTNSWVYFGSDAEPAFWKDAFGLVHLRGVMKSGTVGSPAFTLPPSYRPPAVERFVVLSNDAVGRIDVGTDGTVTPKSPSSNIYVSLSGIRFRTS
jgi:hypothetical protein